MASASARSTQPTKLPSLSARPLPRATAAAAAPSTPPREGTARGRLPRAAAAAAASSKANGPNTFAAFVVFPELPDQLLCAPDNSAWVYGQYALSFFASEAAAVAKLEKKLTMMMREAQRLYEVSRAYFIALRPEEQRAEVLRCAATSTAPTTSGGSSSGGHYGGSGAAGGNSNNNNNNNNNTPHPVRAPAAAATTATEAATASSMEDNVFKALRHGWPQSVHNTNAHDYSKVEIDDAAAEDDFSSAEQDAPVARYAPGLRVNLVLDIVASRKTLGTDPVHSRAYRIAETLYRRVLQRPSTQATTTATTKLSPQVTLENRLRSRPFMPKASSGHSEDDEHDEHQQQHPQHPSVDALRAMAPHVRTFIIGVSDTDVTLVGRDVVCPYRHLQNPVPLQQRVRSAMELLLDAQQQQQQQQQQQRPTSSPPALPAGGAGAATADRQTRDGAATCTAAIPRTSHDGADGAGACPSSSAELAALVTRQVSLRHSVDALLPGPYARVPPVLLGQLDQTRLILCAPPVDWTPVEGV